MLKKWFIERKLQKYWALLANYQDALHDSQLPRDARQMIELKLTEVDKRISEYERDLFALDAE